jgi:multidrug efflux pump
MIPHFFIDRPIFAAVLSIVITLTGALALLSLPIAQYPEISPPSVQVAISYPGASAEVVADTVAAPIEQQVNGVEGMFYMSSQSGNDGSYTLTVTFDVGTDLNTALVMVQNRVTLAIPQLPTQVQMQGITIKKKTPDILLVINFYSPDGRYDDIYLSNFAYIYVRDELFRLEGVSDINILGERDYSIRAWLDPQKMASLNLTANEITAAIRTQNIEAAAGQVGQPPAPSGQSFQLPLHTLGRLSDPEQFGDIIIKVGGLQNRAASSSTSSATPTTTAPGQPMNPSGSSTQPGMANTGQTMQLGLNNPSSMSGQSGQNGSSSSSSTGTAANMAIANTPSLSVSNTGTASTNSSGLSSLGSSTSSDGAPNPLSNLTSATSGGSSVAGGLVGQSSLSPLSTSTTSSTPTATANSTSAPTSTSSRGGPGIQSAAAGKLSVAGPRPPAAAIVRLRDVARVEMGAQNYNQACTFDGRPSVGLGVHQLPGTNALDVANALRKKMAELKTRFPDGVEYEIAYDTTPFIRESVNDVVHTLLEAVVLVAIVVLAFLQNWRAALIPLVAVPVAIVGTFAIMAAVGFSLNNISLFGLVLAIGIVVDDAIVVVENVERWLEQGAEPREATRKAMDEVTGPVVAVALVLCAVFVPCAFIGGITGRFFRQFAVTIAASTTISAFNSLTLSPALAALLLKKHGGRRDPLTWLLDTILGWFFRLFNKMFDAVTSAYVWTVRWLLRLSFIVLVAYGILVAVTYFVFSKAPTGFIPDQDQGRLIISVQLPDSASLQRTRAAMAQVEKIADANPGVQHSIGVSGMSLLLGANASNFGTMFVILKPFDERRDPGMSANAIMAQLRKDYAREVKDAIVNVLGAPPIPGLSVAGGFKIMIEDRAGLGPAYLQRQTDRLITGMRKIPGLVAVLTQYRANTPQLYMDIDRTKTQALGVSFDDIDQTLQVNMGSSYVNSFNIFGRYWQVTAQAAGDYRKRESDVNYLEVRNNRGEMVPFGTLATMRENSGPVLVQRYTLYPAAPVTGNVLPSLSSGDAINAIDALATETLPRSMSTEWTELFFIQIRAGNTTLAVFAVAVVFVFLALAALYESWSMPLAVILVVPLCLLCSVVGVLLSHTAVNIFVQIGLVVLVGLACKNAILIVEFAKQLREQGKSREDAVLEACKLRLRPILMTSFAFILGVVPLVIARGAGAEMRQSLGTAVFSGMLGVTIFGIFLTPVFFAEIDRLSDLKILENRLVRRLVGPLFGAALGVGMGALLMELHVVRSHRAWIVLTGCGLAGFLVGELVVRGYRSVVPPQPAGPAPPASPPAREDRHSGDRQP